MMEAESLSACEESLGYRFQDSTLLERALTHSSNKSPERPSNERLEFLGDAVLGTIMSEFLYHKFEDFTEGQLTKIKSVVVSSRTLGKASRRLGLQEHMSVGKGVVVEGHLPLSILGNLFEAIIAAIYLDGGLESARRFILDNLAPDVDRVLRNRHPRNYKSLLQHLVQKRYNEVPTYRVLAEQGPDHSKEFRICANVHGRDLGFAWGQSKKEAEQLAAQQAFEILRGEGGGSSADGTSRDDAGDGSSADGASDGAEIPGSSAESSQEESA